MRIVYPVYLYLPIPHPSKKMRITFSSCLEDRLFSFENPLTAQRPQFLSSRLRQDFQGIAERRI
jgi:hypothetical protein